jgi:diaminopimelate decarboxylase
MLSLLPDSAALEGGSLSIGGVAAADLAAEFGTPLVVYCEATVRARARAYRAAAPDALVVFGTKAFPNVEILRLLATEGIGADVSTLGELEFALRAGIPADRLVVHGNNKSDEELAAAARAGAGLLAIDALDEVERAAAAGVRRVLVRITPGIEAETHESIRTAHHGSKFGLAPTEAREALVRARDAGLETAGLHVHIGSQLLDGRAAQTTAEWLAAFSAELRSELEWTPGVLDLGGGLGIRYTDRDDPPSIADYVGSLLETQRRAWALHDLPEPRIVLEPGRSLVGTAGVTLYRVGAVKRAGDTHWVAIDGGLSDNPRPQLYGARFHALLAERAGDPADGTYSIAGKHCESGDVLIEQVDLPQPNRGDLLAVPATGAYTLGMSSNYNGVTRPAAVLVRDGDVRLIRRRETIEDLLSLEQ